MAGIASSLNQTPISNFRINILPVLANTQTPHTISLCKAFEISARGNASLKVGSEATDIALGNYKDVKRFCTWSPQVAVNFVSKTIYIQSNIDDTVEITEYF